MYKARIRDDFEFDIDRDTARKLDIVLLPDGRYHMQHKGRLFTIEVVDIEPEQKVYTLRINGHVIRIDVDDEYEQLVRALGMDKINQNQLNKATAPMPGMVTTVLVNEGDVVEVGTPLLILEAMKMENVLKSPMQGRIKRISVKPGQAVDKNTLLVELDNID